MCHGCDGRRFTCFRFRPCQARGRPLPSCPSAGSRGPGIAGGHRQIQCHVMDPLQATPAPRRPSLRSCCRRSRSSGRPPLVHLPDRPGEPHPGCRREGAVHSPGCVRQSSRLTPRCSGVGVSRWRTFLLAAELGRARRASPSTPARLLQGAAATAASSGLGRSARRGPSCRCRFRGEPRTAAGAPLLRQAG